MSPSNPSRKRVLPSWMKNAKSLKSSSAASSSRTGGVFLDSNNSKDSLSASRENPTDAEETNRIGHKSVFVPRNTVLYVMSELELLETGRLILEEDDNSPSPVPQSENLEVNQNDNGSGDGEEQQQQNLEHFTNPNGMHAIFDISRNGSKNLNKMNCDIANDSLNHKIKCPSKRKLDESPQTDEYMEDKDAMDIEPSPIICTDINSGQSSASGFFSLKDNNNKNTLLHLSNQNTDTNIPSSNTMPTQKKRLKPNLSVLDEIFF